MMTILHPDLHPPRGRQEVIVGGTVQDAIQLSQGTRFTHQSSNSYSFKSCFLVSMGSFPGDEEEGRETTMLASALKQNTIIRNN